MGLWAKQIDPHWTRHEGLLCSAFESAANTRRLPSGFQRIRTFADRSGMSAFCMLLRSKFLKSGRQHRADTNKFRLTVGDARQGAGTDGEWSLPWSVQRGKSHLWSQTDRLPGGAGGVANDDPASGDERGGETSLSRAESSLRVWESWTSPKVAAGGQGPGACPWRMRSSNGEPKGRSASYLVSK